MRIEDPAYDWVWHRLVEVAPLLNDSILRSGRENADLFPMAHTSNPSNIIFWLKWLKKVWKSGCQLEETTVTVATSSDTPLAVLPHPVNQHRIP
jgi:hypothetical protein